MKRQKLKQKRQNQINNVITVTTRATKKRQRTADEVNTVTSEQLLKLKILIEKVNLLPHLPQWIDDRLDGTWRASPLYPTLDWEVVGLNEYSVRAELSKIVQSLPPELQKYIRLGDMEEIKFYCEDVAIEELRKIDFTNIESVDRSFEKLHEEGDGFWYFSSEKGSDPRFTNVFLARGRLIELLAAQELLYAFASEKPQKNLLFHARLYRRIEEYSIAAGLYIDSDGRIKTSLPKLFKDLENLDATRIRKCQICLKIFWADHGRMKFCSEKCGTTARVRTWREKGYPEKYKLQRIKKAEMTEANGKSSKSSSPKKKTRTQKGK